MASDSMIPKNNILVILASSRSHGNTRMAADHLAQLTRGKLVDLNEQHISVYDYDHKNREDDFLKIISDFTANFDMLVLATPVYWYTMSAQMKMFVDRFSDILTIEKNLGRKLRGKSMVVISCSDENLPVKGFEIPFQKTAEYLGMKYLGMAHTSADGKNLTNESMSRLNTIARKACQRKNGN